MALPNVSVNLKNGQLGQIIQSDDGLTGMLLQGPAPTDLALLAPKLLTRLEDAVDLGIDADYDTDNTVEVYKHIREFYAEAGAGAKLYIMLVSQAVDMTTMLDNTENDYAKKLLNFADGKIRMLVVTRSVAAGYAGTITDAIDDDVTAAIDKGNQLAEEYAAMYKPFRVILPGMGYTGDAGALFDLKTKEKNRVVVLIGDTGAGRNAAVALLAGRLASVPVMRNPGRVKSGPVETSTVYISDLELREVEQFAETIHDKGFITFRTYVGKSGYYFSDDPTATSDTDDYNSFARGRVIDKAIVIAYTTFVNEILDEVEINPITGYIQTAKAKYYQAIIDNAVNSAMTETGEISSFSALVDPTQNVLSTGKICVEARIVPVGYAKQIVVNLGFDNPAISL